MRHTSVYGAFQSVTGDMLQRPSLFHTIPGTASSVRAKYDYSYRGKTEAQRLVRLAAVLRNTSQGWGRVANLAYARSYIVLAH